MIPQWKSSLSIKVIASPSISHFISYFFQIETFPPRGGGDTSKTQEGSEPYIIAEAYEIWYSGSL